VSTFVYIARRGPCKLCGGVEDCRVNDRGGAHCRRTDRNSPPYGWIFAGDDTEGFGIYWPDDGRSPEERRGDAANRRVASAKASAAAAKAAGLEAPPPDSSLSFEAIGARQRELTPLEREVFVRELLGGVSTGPAATVALGVRFMNDVHFHGEWAYVFPERDGDERITGFNLRLRELTKDANGKPAVEAKKKRTYGPRGLFIPAGWNAIAGPIYVPEGVSDTLALTAMGLVGIGRASNTGGAPLLASLLRRYGFAAGEASADVPVIILGENDAKPNGTWPGRDGAERVARRRSPRR
jgi:hypothetical protein